MNIFINIYDNSSIDCNKKIKIKHMIYIIILLIVIDIKMALLFIYKAILLLIHVTSKSSAKHVDRVFCFLVLLSNK